MLVTCDVGNTSIKIVVYNGNKRIAYCRFYNDIHLDFVEELASFFERENIKVKDVQDSIISSVVPSITPLLTEALSKLLKKEPLIIDGKNYYGIVLSKDVEDEVGSDLLVMSAYAYQKYQKELIVVSLGTATVLCHITKDGEFSHCIIAPGYRKMAEVLYSNAAKLPEFRVAKRNSFLANNTKDAMSVGCVDGFIGMLKYLINGMINDLDTNPYVVCCGGAGKDLVEYITEIDEYESDFVSDGLNYIYRTFLCTDWYWHLNHPEEENLLIF